MYAVNAVVLGGGKSPVNAELPKGNTEFNGNPLARRMYDALVTADCFDRIALVMNPDSRINLREQDEFVPPTYCNGAWRSGVAGIRAVQEASHDYTLFAGDLPFVTGDMVAEFMQLVDKTPDAGIVVPVIQRTTNEERFPQRSRTYLPLREGDFLFGNMGYLSAEMLEKNIHRADEIASSYRHKMRFIGQAISYLGLQNVLRSNHPKLPLIHSIPGYQRLFPKLSIADLEDITSTFTGTEVRLPVFDYAEVAFDIDKPRQLDLATQLLSPPLPLHTVSNCQ